MKKRITTFFLLLICLHLSFGTALICIAAENVSTPTVLKDVYVYDDDNIIEDSVENKLNKMLTQLEQKTEVEFAVISIKSLNDLTIEDYANDLFNKLGIGKKGKNNGILLLISRSDKRVRLEIGKGLEGCLNDAKCGRILDKYFVPYRENDEYTNATDFTVQAVINALKSEYEFEISDLDEDVYVSDEEELSEEELTVLLLIIIIIIVVAILGAVFGGSSGGGSFSSGGSSYSGGGSSFGGFGGGISGGGGASR